MKRVFLLVIAVAIGLAVWRSLPAPTESSARLPVTTAGNEGASPWRPRRAVVPVVEPDLEDKKGCLSERQLEGSPAVLREARRRDGVETLGPHIEVFRSVPHEDVRAMAESGDSAAMVVYAARLTLMALDRDPNDALDELSRYGPTVLRLTNPATDQRAWLEEAAHWYHEAALHGRVFALRHFGELQQVLSGGPVELGWVSQAVYDTLDDNDRHALAPLHAYQLIAYDLHPELTEGMFSFLRNMLPDTASAASIRAPVMAAFVEERTTRGLRPAQIPPSLLTIEGIMRELCASDFARLFRKAVQRD